MHPNERPPSSVLKHTSVGPDQRDETTLPFPLEEEHDGGTIPWRPCFAHALRHRQNPAKLPAATLPEEPVAVVHGLQVVCEGTDPIVEYTLLAIQLYATDPAPASSLCTASTDIAKRHGRQGTASTSCATFSRTTCRTRAYSARATMRTLTTALA
jgi:hypothetical protein